MSEILCQLCRCSLSGSCELPLAEAAQPHHLPLIITGDCHSPLGGAISNMYAMLLARFKMFPEVKEKGMSSIPKLAAFTSEHVGPTVATFLCSFSVTLCCCLVSLLSLYRCLYIVVFILLSCIIVFSLLLCCFISFSFPKLYMNIISDSIL